jgi:ligand-binding SRPBCC domain-containing protein
MPSIHLRTKINAKINICFDLSRSVDLHTISTSKTKEKAIDGVTAGVVKLNDSITWEATHLGIRQQLTSKITQFEEPKHFRDEQIKGAFKFMKHDHYFEECEGFTVMTDHFQFSSPYGVIGKIVDALVLKRYLRRFLIVRNSVIKDYAESGKWKLILSRNE